MKGKIQVKIKDGKVKILELDGHLIDMIKPMNLEDFTEYLVLKYNRKKRENAGKGRNLITGQAIENY